MALDSHNSQNVTAQCNDVDVDNYCNKVDHKIIF